MRIAPLLSAGLLSISALVIVGLSGAPSEAEPLTFTQSGPGLTTCPEGLCLDLTWRWTGDAPNLSDEITLSLPTPDPGQWILLGGSIHSFGSMSATGVFQPGDLMPYHFAGSVAQTNELFDQNGNSLTKIGWIVFPECGEDGTVCSDGDQMPTDDYTAITDDPSLLGPLTVRYQITPNWNATPNSESHFVNWLTDFHLVYSSVPEPSTALLLVTGLLGYARWRRLHA
jgi:hypothetical protein